MEQSEEPEITEFRSLVDAIRAESALLKNVILNKEEEEEEMKILDDFDNTVQIQVYSTINNLVKYQLDEWRELVDGGDGGGDGAGPARS